jgi:hypothetical protein
MSAVGGVAAVVYCTITLVLAASQVGSVLHSTVMLEPCRHAALLLDHLGVQMRVTVASSLWGVGGFAGAQPRAVSSK